tara:strand:+ start:2114 stop:2491 length:378 start_codon:yes stop_codon:yes gene_type:complete
MANTVILMGRLGAKPELRRVGSQNTAVVDISVATAAFAKGEKTTDWHNVTLWDKQAELVCSLDKGEMVFVEGSLKHDEYTANDGSKRRKTYVKAYRFEFCGSKPKPKTGAVGPQSNPYGDDDLRF